MSVYCMKDGSAVHSAKQRNEVPIWGKPGIRFATFCGGVFYSLDGWRETLSPVTCKTCMKATKGVEA